MAWGKGGIDGVALSVTLVGSVLLYSGLKGKSISGVARSLLAGTNPAGVPQTLAAAPTVAGAAGYTPTGAVDVVGAAVLGGFQTAPTAAGRSTVVAAAQSQLGKPYAWATPVSASDPNPSSFDCSGLTMWCYKKAGASLTHFTGTQYLQLAHRPWAQAQPGDLMFLQSGVGNIHHVMLYIGNGQVIEAPDYGIPVRVRAVSATEAEMMPNVGVFPGG